MTINKMQQSMVKYTLRRCKQGPENHTNKAISILSSCVNEHARKRKTCEKNLQICRAAGLQVPICHGEFFTNACSVTVHCGCFFFVE